MADRFYLPSYKNCPDRLPCLEDIGNVLTIGGLVLQGMGSTLVLMSPNLDVPDADLITFATPSISEWGEIIRRSDDPVLFVGEVGGVNKTLHRKQRYALSGEVQQRVWARDGFKCLYCGGQMGKVLITVDHWIPLEMGGKNDESNYISACRRDNKQKGLMMPQDFCKLKGYDFAKLKSYMDSL